jgi:basic membrane lipoprotein Med (substrate-binding protein (PBP1-ABC) superfamily)
MSMKLVRGLAGFAIAASFASAACAADKPLIVYVSPNPLGVNDFLKLGKAGTEKVAAELGADVKTFESAGDPTTQRQNLEAAAKSGAKVVITIGFEFNDMLPEVAPNYPDVKFLSIDSCPFDKMKPNIFCSVFREWEASFLTGAEAALPTKTGKVLAAGAGSNGGIFKAMEDLPGANAFGVDVNQCLQAPGIVMDNIEKKTDVSVELAVKGIMDGTQQPITALGLKEGGMALTGLADNVKDSKCTIADYPDVIAKIKELRDQIVSGALKLDDPMMAK